MGDTANIRALEEMIQQRQASILASWSNEDNLASAILLRNCPEDLRDDLKKYDSVRVYEGKLRWHHTLFWDRSLKLMAKVYNKAQDPTELMSPEEAQRLQQAIQSKEIVRY